MVKEEKVKEHKGILTVCLIAMVILINGCYFPIINFNPANPVHIGMAMRVMIIVSAIAGHAYVGILEAVIFAENSGTSIGIFNVFLVLCGLVGRYLLEFGEISNVYNFTITNIVFQTVILASISTIACLWEQGKFEFPVWFKNEKDENGDNDECSEN